MNHVNSKRYNTIVLYRPQNILVKQGYVTFDAVYITCLIPDRAVQIIVLSFGLQKYG